jgi:hypothetical protein
MVSDEVKMNIRTTPVNAGDSLIMACFACWNAAWLDLDCNWDDDDDDSDDDDDDDDDNDDDDWLTSNTDLRIPFASLKAPLLLRSLLKFMFKAVCAFAFAFAWTAPGASMAKETWMI